MFDSPWSHFIRYYLFPLLEAKASYSGPVVKRLRRRPFTAKAWVRFPSGSLKMHSAIYFLYILSELQKGSGSNPDDSLYGGHGVMGALKKDASWICLYSSVGKSAPLIRERSLVQIQFQVLAGKSNGRSLAS